MATLTYCIKIAKHIRSFFVCLSLWHLVRFLFLCIMYKFLHLLTYLVEPPFSFSHAILEYCLFIMEIIQVHTNSKAKETKSDHWELLLSSVKIFVLNLWNFQTYWNNFRMCGRVWQIQFILNRIPHCELHQAVDRMKHLDSLFPQFPSGVLPDAVQSCIVESR